MLDERFKKEIVEAYKGLDVHVQHAFPTIVSAINAGLIQPTESVYHDIFLWIDTGVPRFTKFPVTLIGDWYGDLTKLIASRLGKATVDVVYQGQPIILLPAEELINLSHSRVKFQVMDAKLTFDSHPQTSLAPQVPVIQKKATPDELVERLRNDFVRYVKTHPESEENLLSIVRILGDNNTALNFVSDWIKAGIELPQEAINVVSEILNVVDPTPAVTPIVNAFAQAIRSAANTTVDSIAGSPATDVVLRVFNDAFDPSGVVNAINSILGIVVPSSSSSSSDSPLRVEGRRYGISHRKKHWVYDKSKYGNVTIGEAYSMAMQDRVSAINQVNIEHRLFQINKSTRELDLIKHTANIDSNTQLQVEIDAMRSKNKRFVSKVKNQLLGFTPHVLIGLFRVNGRGHTDYSRCYYLTLKHRSKDRREITFPFGVPSITNASHFRIVIWEERRPFTGNSTDWGSITGKAGNVPPFVKSFDVHVNAINPKLDYASHPFIDAENDLLGRLNTSSIEEIQATINKLVGVYTMKMGPAPQRDDEPRVLFPPGSSSKNPPPLPPRDGNGIPPMPNKQLPVNQLLSSDVEITLPDAAQYIKEVREIYDEITDQEELYLLCVLAAIVTPESDTYIPIYSGKLHDAMGRNRESEDFVKKGLNTFGTDFFGIDKHGIHIFGTNRIYLAFRAFLMTPQTTIVAAIKQRYPNFTVNLHNVPHLADYTGDNLPIDRDDVPQYETIGKLTGDLAVAASALIADAGIAAVGLAQVGVNVANSAVKVGEDAVISTTLLAADVGMSAANEVLDADITDDGKEIKPSNAPPPPLPRDYEGMTPQDLIKSKRRNRVVVSKVTKKSSFNPERHAPLFSPSSPSSSSTPAPSIKNSFVPLVGCKMAAGGIITHGECVRLNVMDEYKHFQDYVKEEDKEKFHQLIQVMVTYRRTVEFYMLISPYNTLSELAKDDPDLKFEPKSRNRLAYKEGRVFIVLRRGETLDQHFWPRFMGKSSRLENVCALANGGRIELIPISTVLLHIAGHDTDFTKEVPGTIGDAIPRVVLQEPSGNVREITLTSPTATLNDINNMAGGIYDSFSVMVEGKHKHDKTYYLKHHGDYIACHLHAQLPYSKDQALVLKAYESPHTRGFQLLNQGISKVPHTKLGVVYINPSKDEIAKAITARFTLQQFIDTFVLPIKKNDEDVYSIKGLKMTHSISNDFKTITINGEEFDLQKKSTDPLIYVISK